MKNNTINFPFDMALHFRHNLPILFWTQICTVNFDFVFPHIPILKISIFQLTDDGLTLDNARSEFSDLLGLQVTDEFVSENNPMVVAGNQLLLSSGILQLYITEYKIWGGGSAPLLI